VESVVKLLSIAQICLDVPCRFAVCNEKSFQENQVGNRRTVVLVYNIQNCRLEFLQREERLPKGSEVLEEQILQLQDTSTTLVFNKVQQLPIIVFIPPVIRRIEFKRRDLEIGNQA
jgi:hypothetical protein